MEKSYTWHALGGETVRIEETPERRELVLSIQCNGQVLTARLTREQCDELHHILPCGYSMDTLKCEMEPEPPEDRQGPADLQPSPALVI